ncbi:MAG TPA: CcoQ/FixQ family Cbb3-type cytochrome c oxidase assembly chaperone [Flavobacteriales bacterium]|jgi:cytochrome c oxidase cbb3-type subunit 4|nr:CcoQ/FixQ family Cbb3-type cytochrome c oxidase assembly chaperone [Flavobacteriales bacterium]HOY28645.1 CcoQ/FixQ family Cbb3-type cytochrome c oxidase assembly chaperone [Flavobacteriales bacterium]
MLKFIKHHLDTIVGIGIYPLISFVLFFSIFIVAVLYVWKATRTHIDHMAAMPLSEGNSTNEPIHHAHQ